MSSQRISVFSTFSVCLAMVVCSLNLSVQGGLQSRVCEFDCSNIGAVDAICGGHICSDGPLSNEASESLCSNLCQAAIADLNNDDCEATPNRGTFYTAVDNLNSRLLTLCNGDSDLVASVVSEEDDSEDELATIEGDLDEVGVIGEEFDD